MIWPVRDSNPRQVGPNIQAPPDGAAQSRYDTEHATTLMETSRSIQRDRVFRFGPFELSEHDAELRKGGVRTKLQDQPFRVLVELVANAGKVVSREELQQKLWSADTFVDFDVGLNNDHRSFIPAH